MYSLCIVTIATATMTSQALTLQSLIIIFSLQARLQRGNVLLKQGRLDEAHIDYEAVVGSDSGISKINNHLKILF